MNEQFLQLIFGSILSGLGVLALIILNGLRSNLKKIEEDFDSMSESIKNLNEKVGVSINNIDWHKDVMDKQQKQIDDLYLKYDELNRRRPNNMETL